MSSDFTESPPSNANDQLGFSLFLALAVHALIIFGIGFSLSRQEAPAPTLEVTLAQHKTEHEPKQANMLAQFNQLGSGDNAEHNKITTDHLAELPAPDNREATSAEAIRQEQRNPQPKALLTTQSATKEQAPDTDWAKDSPGEQQRNINTEIAQEFSSLRARLDQQRQDYSQMPRVNRLTSVSTRSSAEAGYMRYWVERVEQTGNENYPEEARRKRIYGDLRLAVVLLPNGSVESIEILLSSGQRVLDQAAIRIVRQASPFAPFPPELSGWDKLEIIRTWRFVRGDALRTN